MPRSLHNSLDLRVHGLRAGSRGFTLLELMAAMVILIIALSVSFQAFSATIRGWKRGTEVVEGLQHGDFAMNQFVSAINSMMFFDNARKTYAFTMERDSIEGLPADIISFVTVGPAFLPAHSPFRNGPHRIELFIDYDVDGAPALFSMAYPAVSDLDEIRDEYDTEPHLVTRAVQGIEVLFWDKEAEEWTDDEWTKPNEVPERILLSIFVPSEEDDEEPVVFSRVLDIPVYESVASRLKSPTTASQGGQ